MVLKEIITVLIIVNRHFMANCRPFNITVGGTFDHNFTSKGPRTITEFISADAKIAQAIRNVK